MLETSNDDNKTKQQLQYNTENTSINTQYNGLSKEYDSKIQIFDYNEGATAAHTLEGMKSIKSPMILSNVSTITGPVQAKEQQSTSKERHMMTKSQSQVLDIDNEVEDAHQTVQDMLQRYQEKYRKQKQDSMKFKIIDMKRVEHSEVTQEDDTDEYVNRSFISTSKGNQKGRKVDTVSTNIYGDKDGAVSISRPFDFIENSTQDEYRSNDVHQRS